MVLNGNFLEILRIIFIYMFVTVAIDCSLLCCCAMYIAPVVLHEIQLNKRIAVVYMHRMHHINFSWGCFLIHAENAFEKAAVFRVYFLPFALNCFELQQLKIQVNWQSQFTVMDWCAATTTTTSCFPPDLITEVKIYQYTKCIIMNVNKKKKRRQHVK